MEFPPPISYDLEDGVTLEMQENWLMLCRLLHRMKHQEDIPEDAKGQSWHSLIVRAQLAQDMWKSLSPEVASRDFEVYQRMSNKVDYLCRRAHRVAEERRANSPPDLIDEIFFSNDGDNESDSEESDSDSEGEKDKAEEQASVNSSDASENDDDPRRNITASPVQNHSRTATTPMTNEQLQKAQREQMEEAIAQMARHMKEATKGIANTLQQQNQGTLNELETVAEQNVQEIAQVASEVAEHNQRQWRKNFSIWSMMFLLAGIFGFTLLTIVTIPKHPTASLLGKGGMVRTTVSWASRNSLRVVRWVEEQSGITMSWEVDKGPVPAGGDWERLLDEKKEEREKLESFVASRHGRDPDRSAGGEGYLESEIAAGGGGVEHNEHSGGATVDVNMDELIASLNREAQKTLEQQQKEAQQKPLETETKRKNGEMNHKPEVLQQRERDQARRLEREEAARKSREQEEVRVRAEEAAIVEAERLAKKEQEIKERQEAIRMAREEAERKEREKEEARIRAEEEETERKAQLERERLEREEEVRRAREEEAAEAERQAQQERDRKEGEAASQRAREAEEEARKSKEEGRSKNPSRRTAGSLRSRGGIDIYHGSGRGIAR